MNANAKIEFEVNDIESIDSEDLKNLLFKFSGRLSAEEKIVAIRIALGLNQMADVGTVVSEIINLKR